jgi:hypothetical protein
MMVSYASLVKSIMEASIEQTEEWFEKNMDGLRHLEESGFNVQSLQCTLTKLSQIKSNTVNYIEEIDKLEEEIEGKTSFLSPVDELLDEKDAAVALHMRSGGPTPAAPAADLGRRPDLSV